MFSYVSKHSTFIHLKEWFEDPFFLLEEHTLLYYLHFWGACFEAEFVFFATTVVVLKIWILLFAAIGGATGELLEQNAQVLNQISANLAALQVKKAYIICLFLFTSFTSLLIGLLFLAIACTLGSISKVNTYAANM